MSESTFWARFVENADLWSSEMRSGRQREVFDAIDELLQTDGLSYCFDITMEDMSCLLIFSPEGDRDTAAMIDKLVETAPAFGAWRVLGRRPKKPLKDAAAIVRYLYRLDPLVARYHVSQIDGMRGIDMFVPTSADLTPKEGQGMVNTFLWHAIGEAFVMDRKIQGNLRFDDEPSEPTVSAGELVVIASEW